jgi:hypothetical protein
MEAFIIKNFVIEESQEGVTWPTISTFKLAKGNLNGHIWEYFEPYQENECLYKNAF